MSKKETAGRKKAVVIGAGFGGLAAAIRLAAAGYRVRVYEQASQAGGKAGSFEEGGYRFDSGPSLVTMKDVFSDLFRAADASVEDALDFIPLDPICTYYFVDGTRLEARAEPEDFADEAAAVTGENPAHIRRFLEHSSRIYRRTAPLFLEHSLHAPSTYGDPTVIRSIFRRGRLDTGRTMDEANSSFFRDPRLVQLFDRYATYNGSDPYRVPGTLNIIPHVEYNMGSYAVGGGIFSISSALKVLAEGMGVEFVFCTRVKEILREAAEGKTAGKNGGSSGRRGRPGSSGRPGRRGRPGRPGRRGRPGRPGRPGRVTGVAFNGGSDEADVVVSDADARLTYEKLLRDPDAPYAKRYRRLEPSSSGLVFFWGMKSEYPELGVNNIFFSGDYPAEFRSIFRELRCPDDPTVYVNITSKVSPGDAPGAGGENWFVLINAPRNEGQDWERETERMRAAAIRRISDALGRSIENDIAVERSLTPEEIERNTGSTFGSLYGISSNSKAAAFLRHPAVTRRYPNLYFVGGSVHPGGGMPLALLSGKIAVDAIVRRESV